MSEKNKHNEESAQNEPEIVEKAEATNAESTENVGDELQNRIEQLEADLAKEKNDYLFLRADFDNYRKRMLKEREELVKNAAEKTLFALLPIVDDFERGLQATKDAEDDNAVRQGMELIYNKLIKYLADNGVTPMESTGEKFDADIHDAIATIPAPADDLKGKIIDTTQRGYMINGKVLRHAKVVVGE